MRLVTLALAISLTTLAACDSAVPETPPEGDPCLSAASDGVSFPVAVGQRWVYDLSTYTRQTGSTENRSSGRVDVEVIDAQLCNSDSLQFRVRERRVELFDRYGYQSTGSVEWATDDDSTASEQFYTWTVKDSSITTDAPDVLGRGRFGSGPPPFGREAPQFWDGEIRDLVFDTREGPFVTLTQGIGPTSYRVSQLDGNRGEAYMTWTYVGEQGALASGSRAEHAR